MQYEYIYCFQPDRRNRIEINKERKARHKNKINTMKRRKDDTASAILKETKEEDPGCLNMEVLF